jgi:hypothetical protein
LSKKTVASSDMTVLNLKDTYTAILNSIKSNQPVGIEGPPGIGKSAIVEAATKECGLEFQPLLLSQCDPTDVGGFPVVVGNKLERLPLGPIRAAVDRPTVLFLDELTMAPPPVQGAAMRLVYERWAGDVRLNPESRIIMAMNPPEQAAGGYELALPMIGRMTRITMRPEAKEVQDYLFNMGEPGSSIRNLATDIAATTMVAPDLLQIEPPAGSQQSGKPWGAPRSWERAIRCVADMIDTNGNVRGNERSDQKSMQRVFAALLAGNVGDEQAASYMAIRKIRDQLPSVEEIIADPNKAKTPSTVEVSIAALGVTAQVALRAPNCAWIYANRLTGEARAASISIMGRFAPDTKGKWFDECKKSQRALLSQIGEAIMSNYR